MNSRQIMNAWLNFTGCEQVFSAMAGASVKNGKNNMGSYKSNIQKYLHKKEVTDIMYNVISL